MTTESLTFRVERLISEAIELADIGGVAVRSRTIAERIYDTNPELMAELSRPWCLDRLLWIIGRRRVSAWRNRAIEVYPQLVLPGFEGLPRTIFLRNGSRKKLDDATATNVSEHIKMLKARIKTSTKIQRMEAVLGLIQKYSRDEPGITWAEVKRRELAR